MKRQLPVRPALYLGMILACSWGVGLRAAKPVAEQAAAVLTERCQSCHGASPMAGLDLRTREAALRGGGRGAAIIPGDAGGSLLYQVIAGKHDIQMPMGGDPLDPADVQAIEEWIRGGAEWPGQRSAGKEERWWAFVPPRKADPTTQADSPIDAFVNAKLAEKGLTALDKADRRTLIRRAYFDLHGLPPAPEAVDQFVNDPSPDAWPKLVDELLESPRFGERWGRRWLDVVRYADTGGFETDIYFPNAWRYRDYVIQSFNDDKPFDRFVQEQIAGDELWPNDLELRGGYDIPEEKLKALEARIGTGLYTIGPIYHEAALDGRQLRYEWLTDVVDTTGSAFLGLTMGCARCHNHKFDPLTQKDYHRMMAVFSGSEPREVPVVHKMSELGFYSSYPKLLNVEEYQDAVKRIDAAARKRITEEITSRFSSEVQDAFKVAKQERTPEQRKLAAMLELAMTEAGLKENAAGKTVELDYTPNERDERERLLRELGKAALEAKFDMPSATVLSEADVQYPVHMTSRGDFRPTGEVVQAGFPAALSDGGDVDGQRRAAFAKWLTQPDHPLTARVMVNRIWQGHFGRGIVGTPSDFGKQGDEPTHPELLDWLAVDFVENGWKMKRLHRMIMLSDAYQRADRPNEANAATDPENLYLWRMNRQRMDAETLRDAVLAVSGALNLKMGGRPVIPPLTEDEMQGMWATDQWPVSLDPGEHDRRSVYLYVKRSFPMPMLTTFDAPDSSVSCARRDETTVAPQALAMINSQFMIQQAERLAKTLVKTGDSPGQWVEAGWRAALGRAPSAAEAAQAAALFNGPDTRQEDTLRLALLLFNLNEFIYID